MDPRAPHPELSCRTPGPSLSPSLSGLLAAAAQATIKGKYQLNAVAGLRAAPQLGRGWS